jgi:hypothetical protein
MAISNKSKLIATKKQPSYPCVHVPIADTPPEEFLQELKNLFGKVTVTRVLGEYERQLPYKVMVPNGPGELDVWQCQGSYIARVFDVVNCDALAIVISVDSEEYEVVKSD